MISCVKFNFWGYHQSSESKKAKYSPFDNFIPWFLDLAIIPWFLNLLNIISKNIYLNTERIELDKRLLKNFYLSKGYYNVEIVSSSAESKNKNTEIELTYSINAGERYRIKKLSTNIDPVFDSSIFAGLKDEFTSFAGEYYSPFKIQKILNIKKKIIQKI